MVVESRHTTNRSNCNLKQQTFGRTGWQRITAVWQKWRFIAPQIPKFRDGYSNIGSPHQVLW